jgi:hypothetical protein
MLYLLTVQLNEAAAADRDYYVALPALGEIKVVSATFVPDSDGAAAIDGTEIRTISVKQGSTTVATVTTLTGGSAFVAGTAVALTVTAGVAQDFTGGTDTIKVVSVHGGATGKVAKGVLSLMVRVNQASAFPSA